MLRTSRSLFAHPVTPSLPTDDSTSKDQAPVGPQKALVFGAGLHPVLLCGIRVPMKSILTIATAVVALAFGACASKSCPAQKASCCSDGGKCDAKTPPAKTTKKKAE